MKVLITGGAGFIGSNLAHKLLAQNIEVTVLDDLSTGYLKNLDQKINFIKGDIACEETYYDLEGHYDCIFHLAAMVSVPESIKKPLKCQAVNVNGLIRLLKYAREYKVKRFIMASSAAIYGDSAIQSEEVMPRPKSPYGLSKLAGEYLLEMAKAEFNLSYVAFRKFNVFGQRQAFNSAYASVVPAFISRAIKNKALEIYGNGLQTRDFIYVNQVVDYYIQAMNNDIDGVFNLGNSKSFSILDLANKLKAYFPKLDISFKEPRLGDVMHSKANIEKLLKYFNKEAFDFDLFLKNTLDYYLENE